MKNRKCFSLDHEAVHVWCIELAKVIHHLPFLVSTLSESELRRSYEYQSKQSYHHFVVSRAMLRLILTKYLGDEPLVISQAEWGKPELGPSHSIRFNISHSGEYCLIAISRSEVGIDMEAVDQAFDFENVIGHIFTNEEHRAWRALSGAEKTAMFYRKWVSIEAFLKAHGTGWLADQNLIKQAKAIDPCQHGSLSLTQLPVLLDIAKGYVSAVCVLNPSFSIEVFSCDDHMLFSA